MVIKLELENKSKVFYSGDMIRGHITITDYKKTPVELGFECLETFTQHDSALTHYPILSKMDLVNESKENSVFECKFEFLLENGPPSYPFDGIKSFYHTIKYTLEVRVIKKLLNSKERLELKVMNKNVKLLKQLANPCQLTHLQSKLIGTPVQMDIKLNKSGYLLNDLIEMNFDLKNKANVTSLQVQFGTIANAVTEHYKNVMAGNKFTNFLAADVDYSKDVVTMTIPVHPTLHPSFRTKYMQYSYVINVIIYYKGTLMSESKTIKIPISIGNSYSDGDGVTLK